MPKFTRHARPALLAAAMAAVPFTASAESVRVTFTNLSPDGGLATTPLFAGFHDGSFDLFNVGELSNEALERIAEDGTFAAVNEAFAAATGDDGQGAVITAPDGFAGAPVFEPGETVVQEFELTDSQRFLTFAAMVLPSNDFFFGTDDAVELFDADGNFLGPQTLTFGGAGNEEIYDAGTEANTELDAAFLNQAANNTGETTADPIGLAEGFIGSVGGPAEGPNGEAASVLGGTVPSGATIDPAVADFTAPGFAGLFSVTIEQVADAPNVVPSPSALGAGLLGLILVARRRRRAA